MKGYDVDTKRRRPPPKVGILEQKGNWKRSHTVEDVETAVPE